MDGTPFTKLCGISKKIKIKIKILHGIREEIPLSVLITSGH
jgi:hypothetical protein